jgi:hypothetical protein
MLLSLRDDNQPFDSIGPVVNGATIVSAEGEMKEEASDDDVEAPKRSLDGKTPMGFQEEEHIMLDGKRTPYLHRLFLTEKKVSYQLLTALFEELTFLLGNGGNTIDFFYGNGRKGLAVVIPKVKSQKSFLEQARKLQWVEKVLDHLAGADCDKEDAAQWISTYIGKKLMPLSHWLARPLVHL